MSSAASLLLISACLTMGATSLDVDDAGAWTDGACNSNSGITVVIDFQELGGGTYVRCAPGPVDSGFAALRQAGIQFQSSVRFPGFLCKIAGKPENDPCINASPASAYWSYWLAPRGGAWCYSNLGAGSRTPPAGTVEGWSFSLGKTGSTSPPPRVPPPSPSPGVTPSPLAKNDCTTGGSSPASPTTTSQPGTSPVSPPGSTGGSQPGGGGSAGSGEGKSGSAAGHGAPRSPGAAAEGRSSAGGPAGPTASPAGGSGPLDPGGVQGPDKGTLEVAGGSIEAPDDPTGFRDPTRNSGDDEQSKSDDSLGQESAEGSEASGKAGRRAEGNVDLGGDSTSGSPVGVLVASGVILILGSTTVVLRRRATNL